jgi:hypothetical protein
MASEAGRAIHSIVACRLIWIKHEPTSWFYLLQVPVPETCIAGNILKAA